MAKKTKEVLEPLGFTRDQIVKLFKAAKVSKSPHKETNEFLVEKLAELTTEIDDDDLAALEEADEESFDVATAVFEAIEKGQQVVIIEADEEADEVEDEVEVEDEEADEVEVEDEEADETPAPKKGKGKGKASAKPEPKKKGKVPAKPEPKKGKGKVPTKEKAEPKAPRSKGVIYHVVKYLAQGTETKPVTKAKIIAALVPKFKDRTEEAMTVTVNSQINGQLKANKGMVLGKKKMKDGSNGYWIEDIGSFVLE
jgi:hypothetical protein